MTVGQSPKEKSWARGPSELRLPVVALSCTQRGIARLADRPETEIAEYPDLVTRSQAQPEATIGLGRSNHLSAAGELFLHKGSATKDASIGKVAYPEKLCPCPLIRGCCIDDRLLNNTNV